MGRIAHLATIFEWAIRITTIVNEQLDEIIWTKESRASTRDLESDAWDELLVQARQLSAAW